MRQIKTSSFSHHTNHRPVLHNKRYTFFSKTRKKHLLSPPDPRASWPGPSTVLFSPKPPTLHSLAFTARRSLPLDGWGWLASSVTALTGRDARQSRVSTCALSLRLLVRGSVPPCSEETATFHQDEGRTSRTSRDKTCSTYTRTAPHCLIFTVWRCEVFTQQQSQGEQNTESTLTTLSITTYLL